MFFIIIHVVNYALRSCPDKVVFQCCYPQKVFDSSGGMIDQQIDLRLDQPNSSIKTGFLPRGDIRTADRVEFNYNSNKILCLEKLTLTDADGTSFDIIQEGVLIKVR